MPRFAALFDGPYKAKIVTDANGVRTLEKTPATEKLFDFASDSNPCQPDCHFDHLYGWPWSFSVSQATFWFRMVAGK